MRCASLEVLGTSELCYSLSAVSRFAVLCDPELGSMYNGNNTCVFYGFIASKDDACGFMYHLRLTLLCNCYICWLRCTELGGSIYCMPCVTRGYFMLYRIHVAFQSEVRVAARSLQIDVFIGQWYDLIVVWCDADGTVALFQ